MSYSLTINFTPPTGNGYQFVTEYRIKYWPTSSPTSVSTVFTNAFPLVLTDLNLSSYSGTIEAKCGSTYGTPRSFGPIMLAGSGGGGGGATPACPYRVVLYQDDSVSDNPEGCARPGFRIKLTTEGGALVTTSTALTASIFKTIQSGDCANPSSYASSDATLTIPAGQSTSTSYIQTTQSSDRIIGISFGGSNPTTLVNGSLTCNLTYTGGLVSLPTKTIYLNAVEYTAFGSTKGIRWFLSNSANGPMVMGGDLLPFSMNLSYRAVGTGISGGDPNTSGGIDITDLEFPVAENNVSQGATATNWTSIKSMTLGFPNDPQFYPVDVLSESGGYINNPVSYSYNGTLYLIQIYKDYSLNY